MNCRFHSARAVCLLVGVTAVLAGGSPVSAQIYRWDDGELIPGTESITPGPGVWLAYWKTDTHNLRYADLSGGLDLSDSRFYSCWLDYARFTGANLSSANFRETTLANADLSETDLSSASLWNSTLTNADLSEANLSSASLLQSRLTNANLSGATVTGADFSATTFTGFTKEQLYSTASYQTGDLHGMWLDHNDLTGWNFANQNLSWAHLHGAKLINADLRGANLTSAVLDESKLTDADLSGSNLSSADLIWSTLSNANLSGTNLSSANLGYCTLTDANLSGANLSSTQLFRSVLTNANLSGATVAGADFGSTTPEGFTKEQLYSTASYQAGDLQGILLDENDLAGWNFTNQNLSSASLYRSTLTNTDLSGANVAGADFGSTTSKGFTKEQLYSTASYQAGDLQGIWLDHNDLTGWNFANQNLSSANLGGSTLTNVDLAKANLSSANLDGSTLTNGDLSGANLSSAYLGYSTLTNGDLSGANLSSADLEQSTLTNANLNGATVAGANFGGTTSKGFTKEQLYSTVSYQARDLRGIILDENDLTGWNFANQNLSSAGLYGATLTNTDLSGANVAGADFGSTTSEGFTKEQLYSTASYQAGDLQGISLSENDLTGWNFANQNLSSAYLDGSTLTNADLRGANLSSAYLDESTLTGADLSGADLSVAYLGYSTLTNANLSGTNLSSAYLGYSTLADANLSNANLASAQLHGSVLTNANLSGANVTGADFGYTTPEGFTREQLYSTANYRAGDLHGIKLYYKDLTGWNFANQNLSSAFLQDSTLTDADLTGADTRGAQYLTDDQLSVANTTNLIRPNGTVRGLNLSGSMMLLVHDYDGNPDAYPDPLDPVAITIRNSMDMGSNGLLKLVFETDEWDSTISFDPGIPVALGGTLELTFAFGTDLAAQVGRTFDLFDWTGVSPTGTFTLASLYQWDLSRLYTDGEVTMLAVPEPASLMLLVVGGVVALRRRK